MPTTDADPPPTRHGTGVLALSIIIAALSVICALLLWSLPSGGMFPDLGKVLAWLLLGTANIICFLLNLTYLWLSRYRSPCTDQTTARRRGLQIIVGLQCLPALYLSALLVNELFEMYVEDRASEQQAAIRQAIARDDLGAYTQANNACTDLCRAMFSPEAHLLEAARSRAYTVAQSLLSQGVKVSAGLTVASTELRTCEGHYLSSISSLAMAVANNDEKMLRLLLPASDDKAHKDALWTAAELDRLALLKIMERAGLSLTIRGKTLDSNNTLLVAAASGAALHTGRWLIDRGMPLHALRAPDPYPGQSPFSALMEFATQTDSPRTAPFLQLLIQHGANINEPNTSGLSWLQEAIRIEHKRIASLLVEANASRDGLTPEQLVKLDHLMKEAPLEHRPLDKENCIPVS